MSEPLREYHVVINGIATTAMLSDADAVRLNAVPVEPPVPVVVVPVAKAAAPPNMARNVQDKAVHRRER